MPTSPQTARRSFRRRRISRWMLHVSPATRRSTAAACWPGVVGMQVGRPGGAQQFLAGQAEQVAQRLVRLLHVAFEVQDCHAAGRSFESRLQHPFGLPQPAFGAVLLTPQVPGQRLPAGWPPLRRRGPPGHGSPPPTSPAAHRRRAGRRSRRRPRAAAPAGDRFGRQHQRVDEGQQAEPHLQRPGHRPGQLAHQQQHRQRQAAPHQRPPLPLRPHQPGRRPAAPACPGCRCPTRPRRRGRPKRPDHRGVRRSGRPPRRFQARQHPGGKGRNAS